MTSHRFSISHILRPEILVAEKDFLILYKPPRLHSAPLPHSAGESLLHWCAGRFPEILGLPGRREGEGGLLHRLDYETNGLLIIARTVGGMEALLGEHKQGRILKKYTAITGESMTALKGFPKEKPMIDFTREIGNVRIESGFRPYGPGRKAVRPALLEDPLMGNQYVTEILEGISLAPGMMSLGLRIVKGFRHQIRSHLAWLGLPIINDGLYGGATHGNGFLGLRASSLSFTPPFLDREQTFSIPPLESGAL